MFEFSVIDGTTARDIITASRPQIVQAVRETYLAHGAGQSVNPDSYFLRFPEKPDARIIALPAYLGGGVGVAGLKWISSFPANIERGFPRASAALLLNDYETGYPFAVLEASQISAARTAASAVLAAEVLAGGRRAGRLAVVGAGIIARNILEFFGAQQWEIDELVVHDQQPRYARALADHADAELGYPAKPEDDLAAALTGADVVVLATTAGEPYILDPDTFAPGQLVLNISLRDLAPEIIGGAYNVLDDVEHCLKANTSPHLAEQHYGNREFVTGTLADVIEGRAAVGTDRPVVFSPFGLGVLDLAVGALVHGEAVASGRATGIPGFFAETTRW
ncbi:2,3-diaminopropionate biosynthesis protein SbnB [Kitasatospora sp. NPDC097643]|uniref:2,3-diaminopropionate biosynthesis protein SbnB n=1 Tax=Kitasatospora sp. NPDC097643 TaxID=3157230 RepID=UPI00331B3CE6